MIPVGLYGLPAGIVIRKITEKFKIHLIEDAAQSLGGKYSGKMSGSAADVAAFSFHGTKTLTTGEGGMFLSRMTRPFLKGLSFSAITGAVGKTTRISSIPRSHTNIK